jgi:hypothetical protein
VANCFGTPAIGQEQVIRSGNTEIIFKTADSADLPMDRYKAFDEFANDHPELINALSGLSDEPGQLYRDIQITILFLSRRVGFFS